MKSISKHIPLPYSANSRRISKLLASLLFSIACLLLPLSFTSCSENKDDFTPGTEPTVGAVSVYFAGDYQSLYIHDEDAQQDTIKVVRTYNTADSIKNRAQALTIPLEVEASDTALHIPSSVTFKAGKDSADLVINAPYIEKEKKVSFKISIPAEYSNPYQEKNGIVYLESSIVKSSWDIVADTIIFYTNEKRLPSMGCKLENLRGQNRFRFTNFLNTGNPLEFSLKTDDDFDFENITNNVGEIIPLADYQYNTSGFWYFKNGGSWIPFNPGLPWDDNWSAEEQAAFYTDANTISYISFYSGRSYTYLNLKLSDNATISTIGNKKFKNDYDNNYSLMCSWINYYTGDSGWQYFYIWVGYEVK